MIRTRRLSHAQKAATASVVAHALLAVFMLRAFSRPLVQASGPEATPAESIELVALPALEDSSLAPHTAGKPTPHGPQHAVAKSYAPPSEPPPASLSAADGVQSPAWSAWNGAMTAPKSTGFSLPSTPALRALEAPATEGDQIARGIEQRVNRALDEADTARGTGRGGPVAFAIRDAVNRGTMLGSTVFTVTIDRSGTAQIVSGQTEGDLQQWQAMLPGLRADIEQKHVRIPASARAVRFTIHVRARPECPDGSLRKTEEATCPVMAGSPLLGLSLSPENATAQPLRTVHVTLSDETRLN